MREDGSSSIGRPLSAEELRMVGGGLTGAAFGWTVVYDSGVGSNGGMDSVGGISGGGGGDYGEGEYVRTGALGRLAMKGLKAFIFSHAINKIEKWLDAPAPNLAPWQSTPGLDAVASGGMGA